MAERGKPKPPAAAKPPALPPERLPAERLRRRTAAFLVMTQGRGKAQVYGHGKRPQ